MTDIKWIKITTDIFDDEKILLIESMPDADSIIVIWFKLLCLAGRMNNNGVFILNNKIAYTEEMLATIFRRNLNTVRLALDTFEQFGMIERINNVITIPNWEKHQNIDGMDKVREQNRNRAKSYRDRHKEATLMLESTESDEDLTNSNVTDNVMTNVTNNVTSNVTVTQSNGTDKDIEKEKDKNKNKNKDNIVENFLNNYHSICKSLPTVRRITDKRRKGILNIAKKYSEEDILLVFNNAEESNFLTGKNDRGWIADIDFILREDKFISILEGKYGGKGNISGNKKKFSEPANITSKPVTQEEIDNGYFTKDIY